MGQQLIHLNSVAIEDGKPKQPTNLAGGEIAINFNKQKPSLFIKTSDGTTTGITDYLDSRKVTEFTGTPSDDMVPSAKLVRESLNAKQETLVSGTNIKTINGTSLLGSGDITISSEGTYTAGNNIQIVDKAISVTLTGYTKGSEIESITEGDTLNAALGKLEYKVDNVPPGGVTAITPGDGISVKTNGEEGATAATPKISVAIDGTKTRTSEEFIKVSKDGLYTENITSTIDNKISSAITELNFTDTGATTNQYISAVTESNGKISVSRTDLPVVGVADSNKIISLDADRKLSTTLSISYNTASTDTKYRYIQLKGADNTIVSEFDAAAFVKDGMLYGETVFEATGTTQSVTIKEKTHEFTGLTSGNTYLALLFKTDGVAEADMFSWDHVDLGKILRAYIPSSGITIVGNEISAKVVGENGLSLDDSGIKMGEVVASTSGEGGSNGAMTARQAEKLNGIAEGAEVNQNAFSTINNISATTKTDSLTITGGTNVTITADTANKTLTISATDTTYEVATTEVNGLMSSGDKAKLDGIAEGANNYVHPAGSASGKTSGLYKFSTDATSHISDVSDVTKSDITALGIQETLIGASGATGQNIKTINGKSLLITDPTDTDIEISGGSTYTQGSGITIDESTNTIAANFTNELTPDSTAEQIPSAKLIYDVLAEKILVVTQALYDLKARIPLTVSSITAAETITLDSSESRTYQTCEITGDRDNITLSGGTSNAGFEHYILFHNTNSTKDCTIALATGMLGPSTITVKQGKYLEMSWIYTGTNVIITNSSEIG